MRRVLNPLDMIAMAMELNRIIINNDVSIAEQTYSDLVDDGRLNLLICISIWHAPPSLREGMRIWQLFVDCYFPRQKDRVNPPISIPAHLKIVVCNRIILTQTDGGQPLHGNTTLFRQVFRERIGTSLRQL